MIRKLAVFALLVLPSVAHAQPEARGARSVFAWDAGPVAVAGVTVPTVVYHPEASSPLPTVIVMHGNERNGSYHAELGQTLASRGFVVLVPDMPCRLLDCDHDANAAQLSGLLDWAAARSADPATPISGLVDTARLGLVGHSFGGLAATLATAEDARVRALVLFDPKDDGGAARAVAARVTVPNAHVMAQVPGLCSDAWEEDVYPRTLGSKLRVTVAGSAHCDPEDPGGGLCELACGSGDRSTTPVFRRYAVAWLSCFLGGDPSMGPWVGGASYLDDVDRGVLIQTRSEALDTASCASSVSPVDAGSPAVDAGRASVDAATSADAAAPMDAGSTRLDAATSRDGGASGSTDGGSQGCSCAAPGSTEHPVLPLCLALSGLLLVVARRRR